MKIEKLSKDTHITVVDKTISMWLLSCFKKHLPLPKISTLSHILNISSASISKYIRIYNIASFPVLRYMYDINSKNKNNIINSLNHDETIKTIATKIIHSGRILCVGEGNSGLIAKIVYTKLIKKGYNAIFLDGMYDQKEMIKTLTNKDSIICISFSLQHEWVKQIIDKLVTTTLLFTSTTPNRKRDNLYLFMAENKKLRYTDVGFNEIAHVLKHLDDLFILL